MKFLYLLFSCTVLVVLFLSESYCFTDKKIVWARVESCQGCQLTGLHEVKSFIYEDVPQYEHVEFKKVPGAPPEIVFFNADDDEIERVDLRSLSRMDCNELLQNRGFKFSKNKNEL